eukprot:TCALIF_07805-PA protein Name:"Protein of unknown function" AED:0.30 eAED:0.30 QI:0/0/0.5/0.5/0/0.5/2/44/61
MPQGDALQLPQLLISNTIFCIGLADHICWEVVNVDHAAIPQTLIESRQMSLLTAFSSIVVC